MKSHRRRTKAEISAAAVTTTIPRWVEGPPMFPGEAEALLVSCPVCRVPAGAPCNTDPPPPVHPMRVRAASKPRLSPALLALGDLNGTARGYARKFQMFSDGEVDETELAISERELERAAVAYVTLKGRS